MSGSLRARSRSVRLPRPDARAVAAGLALAVGLAAGCGGKVVLDGGSTASTGTGTGTGDGFACDFTTSGAHICEAIVDPTASEISALQTACNAEGGTTPSACSTTNALGTCSESAGGLTASITYYADSSSITASEAQQACTAGGGTWSDG
jgi:hypothetical protein